MGVADDFSVNKNFVHRLPAIIDVRLRNARTTARFLLLFRCCFRRFDDFRHWRCRQAVGLALDFAERRQRFSIVGIALKNALVFENRRGKLAHEDIGVSDAFAGGDDILFAIKLGVSLLENFQGLIVLRLGLGNDLEHFNCLSQLSLFVAGRLAYHESAS